MLEVVLVHPSLLGADGDRGNAMVLVQRMRRRGVDAELTVVEARDALPDSGQIYVLGGGESSAQSTSARILRADGGLSRAVDRGAAVLGVGAGYQIIGNSFTAGEGRESYDGLGLLDVTTIPGTSSGIGEIVTRWIGHNGDDALLTGFENHDGHTTVGVDAQPLARVEVGTGNAADGTEGAVRGTVIGTYLHGPVLARNPALADHILRLALGDGADLAPLHMPEIDELRRQRLARHRQA